MATQTQVKKREQWGSQLGFLMAAIGSAIGLGNIWRFPGAAYENGGGAFMIPYVIALVVAGIPILFLDYALGHRFKGSPPTVFRRISKKLEWLGWWQVAVCFIIMTYYAVIVAWSIRYVFYSLTVEWGKSEGGPADFFYSHFIQVADTPHYSSAPVWNVAIPLAFVWIFALIIIARGVARGVEVANKICIPLLLILFVAMVVRSLTLPGAMDGLNALWTPNFSALTQARVWIAAFAQIFFSLSVGFGIMLTYSSYLKKKSNLVGTGLVAAFANSSFEILAGLGVFATLGFLAFTQGVGVNELEGISGISLSFITFPAVISQMPGGAVFGVLFFLSLSLAGITSFISIIQVVAAAVGEKLGVGSRKAAMIVGIPSAILSLFVFSTQSGIYALDVVDAYVNQIAVVISAVLMCVLLAFVARRLPEIQRHLNYVSHTGKMIGTWWRFLVGALIPSALFYILVSALVSYIRHGYSNDYSREFEIVFGWGVVACALLISVVFTCVRWRTRVDDFVPLDIPAKRFNRKRGVIFGDNPDHNGSGPVAYGKQTPSS